MRKVTRAFLISCLLILAMSASFQVVSAQSEYGTLGERMARIEGILEQMNERMVGLNHLSDRMDTLQNTVNVMWVTVFAAFLVSLFITYDPRTNLAMKKRRNK